MAAYGLDWMDCRVRSGGQCRAPVHDWRILVEVWDQESAALVSTLLVIFMRRCV